MATKDTKDRWGVGAPSLYQYQQSELTLIRSMKPTFSSVVSLNTHRRCPPMSVPSRRLRLAPPGVTPALGVLSVDPSSESPRLRKGGILRESRPIKGSNIRHFVSWYRR